LDVLGVDVIEAGFPATSPGELKAVKMIASEGLNAEVCALARSSKNDINLALDCGVESIHIFIATSDIHLKKKLKISREEAIQRAIESVEYAKEHGVKVEFSAEDATRTEPKYLMEVFKAVVDAGADRIDIPDTVGLASPHKMRYLVKMAKETVDVPISVHCHNDMGLAVANTLAGIEAGALQAHVTINGVGERAGNASLEEVVIALHVLYGVKTNVKLSEIYKTSRFVSRLMGIPIAPNKPIVGDNVFAHESGIHTHGVLASPETYEFIPPELVGHRRRLVAGKHAGIHGIEAMIKEMGFKLTKEQLKEVLKRVKELGDKGRRVTYEDLLYIAENVSGSFSEEEKRINLRELVVVTGNNVTPTATIRLKVNGEDYVASGFGVGPIDASAKAIQKLMENFVNFRLIDFKLESTGNGTDALATVIVKIEDENNRVIFGRSVNEDIVMAGVEAIIDALNRLFISRRGGTKHEYVRENPS